LWCVLFLTACSRCTAESSTQCCEAQEYPWSNNPNCCIACPGNQAIASIAFASYGLPTGSSKNGECGNYAVNDQCDAADAMETVKDLCLHRQSCCIASSNPQFSVDPCSNHIKHLFIKVNCASPRISSSEFKFETLHVPHALFIINHAYCMCLLYVHYMGIICALYVHSKLLVYWECRVYISVRSFFY
jgi:Galactose binding lectin domain